MDKKVYIASYPRSGNTWVRLLLEHSLGFATETRQPVGREFFSAITNRDSHITQLPSLHLVKTHAFAVSGDDPVIYVLRDGRDAAVSYWHHTSAYGNGYKGSFSQFLRELYSKRDWWPDHVYHWLKTDKSHPKIVVRFEDLIKDQEKELGRLVSFLGLEPVRKFEEFKDVLGFEKLNKISPDFFRGGRRGGWTDCFTDEDKRFFLEHDWGMLQQFDYVAREGHPMSDSGEAILREQEGWIRRYIELDNQLHEKEAEIRRLSRECELRLREVENMAGQLKDKEVEISTLAQAAKLRLESMQEKERVIVELREAASERLKAMNAKEEEIQRLTDLTVQRGKGPT